MGCIVQHKKIDEAINELEKVGISREQDKSKCTKKLELEAMFLLEWRKMSIFH